MIDTVITLSQIKVIKRRTFHNLPKYQKSSLAYVNNTHANQYELIAIGTSVGGPQALKKLFQKIPKNFSLPIVVV